METATLGLRSVLENVDAWFLKTYMQLFKILFYELSSATLDFTLLITWQNNIMKVFVELADIHSTNILGFPYMSACQAQ